MSLLKVVMIHANSHGIPFNFPLQDDGTTTVTTLHLSLRFQFHKEFTSIEDEVFTPNSRALSHISRA